MGAAIALAGSSPQTGTFTAANTITAQSQFTVGSGTTGSSWAQYFASDDPASATGTFGLTLTSAGTVGTPTVAGDRAQWLNPHGTFSAALPPNLDSGEPTAQGVNFSVSF